jgi:23S rRNA G2069 N7-methylase RlmK/C1962 C5-methylase RlmI
VARHSTTSDVVPGLDFASFILYSWDVQSPRLEVLRTLLPTRARFVAGQAGDTDCVRLCAGAADDVPGMIVDRFGRLLVAVDYSETSGTADGLLELVDDCLPGHVLVAKVRAAVDGSNRFDVATSGAASSAGSLVGIERGLKFEIGTDPAHDFGLFLDAAKARAFVRSVARDQRVLNLFSYAGAFGIAAAVGGATEVTNVDPNRDYLAWSLRNAKLNDVAMRVLPDTAQDHLAKHLRRVARDPQRAGYNLVIVDPPAFGVGRGNERVLRLLWPTLFASLRAMRPARLILMCNDKSFQARRSFEDLVEEELGSGYRFRRLGTRLTVDEVGREPLSLDWTSSLEDPFYVEPVVLAGMRS